MTTPPVVHREVEVPVGAARAFTVFTDHFDMVKPRDHNLLDSPIVASVLEARVGGRVYDRAEDGTVCVWGRVLAVDPPHRLVFSWDIGPTWQLETDPANASEVEVTFTEAGPGRTRVVLEHRHLDRHGPGWEGLAASVAADAGWPLYLQRFVAAVSADVTAG